MLAPHEFTVGALADAAPLSLLLPRTEYEFPFLVGHREGKPAAIVLAGSYAFTFFESSDNQSWKGLIVPDVRIEVDEASLFEPRNVTSRVGCIIRTDRQLIITGRSDRAHHNVAITLHDNLISTNGYLAAFTRWQIVIGEGQDKRVLWRSTETDISLEA